MRCVWTQWSEPGQKAYRTDKERDMSMILSLAFAKKHGYECVLYTDTPEYFTSFPYDEIIPLPDLCNVRKEYWAYPKIVVYAMQDKPFVHIDNDVFLIQPIPDYAVYAPVFFQNKEVVKFETGYPLMNEQYKAWPVKADYYDPTLKTTYNVGVIGGRDIQFFRLLKTMADNFLFHKENKKAEASLKYRYEANFFFEQYFAGCLVKAFKMENKVPVLVSDISKTKQLVHLWGSAKREQINVERVENRLKKDFPHYYGIISQSSDIPT